MGGWGSASLLPPAPAGLSGTAWLRIHSVSTPRHGGRLPRRKPAWKRGEEPRMSCSCSAPKAKLLLLLSGLLMPVLLLMELAPLGPFSPLAGGRAVVCHEGCTLRVIAQPQSHAGSSSCRRGCGICCRALMLLLSSGTVNSPGAPRGPVGPALCAMVQSTQPHSLQMPTSITHNSRGDWKPTPCPPAPAPDHLPCPPSAMAAPARA